MVPALHTEGQQQTAEASQTKAAELRGSAGAIGNLVRNFGFQAIAALLGIALAFM